MSRFKCLFCWSASFLNSVISNFWIHFFFISEFWAPITIIYISFYQDIIRVNSGHLLQNMLEINAKTWFRSLQRSSFNEVNKWALVETCYDKDKCRKKQHWRLIL